MKEKGLFQSKITSSLASTQRQAHQAHCTPTIKWTVISH